MATALKKQIPPLAAGDTLTREEFMRRWQADPDVKKAELIGGVVFMPSPLSVDHGDMDSNVCGWLCYYKAATPGTGGGSNTTTFMLEDIPQPDQNLRILPEYGGASWVEGAYLHGAPELLVEVCRSSASYDLHQKLELYEQAGVHEYLAVLLFEKEIRWHVLDERKYRLLPAPADGVWRSQVFPGLWLDGQALWQGNMAQVFAKLQEGLHSAEHHAFVAELARKKRP